jgi:hypothetical protein
VRSVVVLQNNVCVQSNAIQIVVSVVSVSKEEVAMAELAHNIKVRRYLK